MKRVESIWAELSANQSQEVEFSEAQKIELGVIDDLKSLEKQAVKIAQDRIAESKEVEKLYQRVNKENFAAKEKVEQLRKEAFRIGMKAEDVLKELGMPVPKELFTRVDAVADAGGKIPTSRNANVFSL